MRRDHVVGLHEGLLRHLPVAGQRASRRAPPCSASRAASVRSGAAARRGAPRAARPSRRSSRTRSRPTSRPRARAAGSARARRAGSPSAHGICFRLPSRFQVQPWKGQRTSAARPGASQSWRPRWRQAFGKARISLGRGAHDQHREVGDLVDGAVADLGDLLLAARELPDLLPEPSRPRGRARRARCSARSARATTASSRADCQRSTSGTGRVSVSSSCWYESPGRRGSRESTCVAMVACRPPLVLHALGEAAVARPGSRR